MFESITADDRVLITGGTGTLGTALIPKLLERDCEVRVMSRDENKQGALRAQYPQVVFGLGDVRHPEACESAVRDCSIVIHAASLKYVDVSEQQPSEYLLTNAGGTLNMIEAVLHERTIRACIGISTDKACLPVNTYGLTKAILEKLFVEAHAYRRGSIPTCFTVCRYGNVIGSRGSVVLKWQEAQRKGERIKVTDPTMTRFFFTVDDALQLISDALSETEGGTIIASAMPSTDLGTLAALWGDYEVIGSRPGEKIHEDLISGYEMVRTQYDGLRRVFTYRPLCPARAETLDGVYTSDTARRLMEPELRKLTAQWRDA